jgi:hypothetical protein
MSITAPELLVRSQDELDDLFRSSEPGPIPVGEGEGTALIAPGTAFSEPAALLARLFAWKGKVFDPEKGELINEIGPFGFHAVPAKIYFGESWFDHRPCIVLDYSADGQVARHIRDEIRAVSPGLYLGIAYWDDEKVLSFSLEFKESLP